MTASHVCQVFSPSAFLNESNHQGVVRQDPFWNAHFLDYHSDHSLSRIIRNGPPTQLKSLGINSCMLSPRNYWHPFIELHWFWFALDIFNRESLKLVAIHPIFHMRWLQHWRQIPGVWISGTMDSLVIILKFYYPQLAWNLAWRIEIPWDSHKVRFHKSIAKW